jgi:predicted negative regulator of RcsB-dependent stress response
MESDVTQSATFYKLWAWGDKNKKQLLWALIALVVVGVIAAFWFAHHSELQNDANVALSKLTNRTAANTPEATPDALLKVASDYAGTDAAQRALLLAAADLFAQGKYDVAQAQFQKFQQEYSGSPFVAQAALGIAACYEAQGKTSDAISGYDNVANRYANQNVAAQAKLGLARLYEAQGKFKESRTALEELSRTYPGTIGMEANSLLQQLNATHPEAPATNSPAAIVAPVAPAHPAVTTTNLKAP